MGVDVHVGAFFVGSKVAGISLAGVFVGVASKSATITPAVEDINSGPCVASGNRKPQAEIMKENRMMTSEFRIIFFEYQELELLNLQFPIKIKSIRLSLIGCEENDEIQAKENRVLLTGLIRIIKV